VIGFDQSTWTEMAPRAGSGAILLLPVGSTEQHGPHLPLTTDTDIALAVATGAAERVDRLVVAPPLAYGSSGEHQGFAGTLSIGRDATELVLVELGRSATVDFRRVVVVCAHGGNSVPLGRALARLAAEGRAVTAWSPPWSDDLHAGRTETSVMLAIDPGRVRMERAEPGDPRPIGTLLPLLHSQGVRRISANGVLGDPTGASADEGHRLLAIAVDDLVGTVQRPAVVSTREVSG
jgi:mycofactocin system creatininase family protein